MAAPSQTLDGRVQSDNASAIDGPFLGLTNRRARVTRVRQERLAAQTSSDEGVSTRMRSTSHQQLRSSGLGRGSFSECRWRNENIPERNLRRCSKTGSLFAEVSPAEQWSDEDRNLRGSSRTRGQECLSPRRTLQDVKAKLARYAREKVWDQDSEDEEAMSSDVRDKDVTRDSAETLKLSTDQASVRAGSPVPSISGGNPIVVYHDASAEIADIDLRLHALQNFLQAAKTSVAQSSDSSSQM
ncbi:hypothetical protein CBR_g474 [Chara braunii]|uniref:Uncharacterized protein n=1 Tax=Chara braunii TaxID=69332 RepID=A0A388KBF7_CHABU|nr:hypothetical protein CBR_g474 [Chara braunii]|eukprot:GBG67336.1 hypothetical protein CBR_g474 [Chara braunii]